MNIKKLSYKKGVNFLIKEGYSQCNNENFFHKDGNYYHWNTIQKKWIFN